MIKMRLSDTQYKVFVRVGIVIVIIAVFAFDRIPPTYQPLMMALAAAGAAIGFFPLFTSRPFQSSEVGDSCAAESEAHYTNEMLDVQPSNSSARLDVTSEAPTHPHRAAVDANLQALDSLVQKVYKQQRQYLRIYGIDHSSLSYGYYTIPSLANRQERSERVKEVHDLIDRLKGTPQTFSVELTGSNSIIVHCEGRSQSSMILDELEKDLLNFDELPDEPMRTIQ
jgi:hypothetical protein